MNEKARNKVAEMKSRLTNRGVVTHQTTNQKVPVEPTADTENKPDTGLTLEVGTESDIDVNTDQATQKRNEDDNTDEATLDSSTPTDDTPDNEVPKEAPENKDGGKQDTPRGPGGETCEEFCIKKSKLDSHKQHTWNIDNENGEKVEGGSDTIVTQAAKESDCISSNIRHDSRPRIAPVASMDVDP